MKDKEKKLTEISSKFFRLKFYQKKI